MRLKMLVLAAIALAIPAIASAQATLPPVGTRLDVLAEGEVTRTPDSVRIIAGVVVHAPTAAEAIRQNAAKLAEVRAALSRAGIADADIQTSRIGVQADYRYNNGQAPQLTGYSATNQLSLKLRDIAAAGPLLDTITAAGANQVTGPFLAVEHPEAALDEARLLALAAARARADLYARALGMQVARVVAVNDSGMMPGMPFVAQGLVNFSANDRGPATRIEAGRQVLTASIVVTFELR